MNALQSLIKQNDAVENDQLNRDVAQAMMNDSNPIRFFTWVCDMQNSNVINYLFWFDLNITKKVFNNWFDKSPDQVNYFFTTMAMLYRDRFMDYVQAIESFGCKFTEATVMSPVYFNPIIVKHLNIVLDMPSICYLLEEFINLLDLFLDDPDSDFYVSQVHEHYEVLTLVLNKENVNEYYFKEYLEKLNETELINPIKLLQILN